MHPLFIRIGHYQLTSYVALLALAGLCSLLYFRRLKPGLGLPAENSFWFLANVIALCGLVGGRLAEMASSPRAFGGWADFLDALATNQTGFSTFGILGGVLIGVFYACQSLKMDFLRTLDYVSLVIPVGHGIARIGCFLNGCCHGCPPRQELPWTVVFTHPDAALPAGLLGVPLHPSQLYEAGGDACIAAVLYFLIRPRVERGAFPRGLVAVGYFAGYGLLRFFNEFTLGAPARLTGIGFTVGQIFSLVIILLAVIFLGAAVIRQRPTSAPAVL